MDYIAKKKPAIFLFENVAALATHNRYGPFFRTILAKLINTGLYDVDYSVLDTKKHGGIPQSRTRVYIVGVLKSKQVYPLRWPREIPMQPIHKFVGRCIPKKMLDPEIDDMNPTNLTNLSQAMDYILQNGSVSSDPWVHGASKPSPRAG